VAKHCQSTVFSFVRSLKQTGYHLSSMASFLVFKYLLFSFFYSWATVYFQDPLVVILQYSLEGLVNGATFSFRHDHLHVDCFCLSHIFTFMKSNSDSFLAYTLQSKVTAQRMKPWFWVTEWSLKVPANYSIGFGLSFNLTHLFLPYELLFADAISYYVYFMYNIIGFCIPYDTFNYAWFGL